MIDKEKALSELRITEEMYSELLDAFTNQMTVVIKALDELMNVENYAEVASYAHFIKGAAGNLRIDSIKDTAYELELEAKENQDKGVMIAKIEILRDACVELTKR